MILLMPSTVTRESTPASSGSRSRMPARDLALIATFAALLAVFAMFTVNLPGVSVPVTLQTFGVMLAGGILGWKRGGLAVATYLLLVLAGLPWTSKRIGGPSAFTTPTGGYLIGFLLGAVVIGLLVRWAWARRNVLWIFGANLIGGIVTVYAVGVPGTKLAMDTTWATAFAPVTTTLPGDLLKAAIAACVAAAVHRAFPELLGRD